MKKLHKTAALVAAAVAIGGAGITYGQVSRSTPVTGEEVINTWQSARLIDTRESGRAEGGKILSVPVPAGEAVKVTVTIIRPKPHGFLSFDGGDTSFLSWSGQGTRSTSAEVYTGGAPTLDIYVSNDTHILVDLVSVVNQTGDAVPPATTQPPVTTVAPPASTTPPVTTPTPPTTTPPTTTPPTTTAPPTTAAPPVTTTAPPTTTPPTTAPPTDVQFFEGFDTAGSMDRFDFNVFHRNIELQGFSGFSGGSWRADHADLGNGKCGGPKSTRTSRFNANDSQATRIENSAYWCDVPPADVSTSHMMTSMGDVDNYSIVSFSPNQVFDSVNSMCVEVNLTDLGSRQWLKFGVVSEARYNSTVPGRFNNAPGAPGFLVSDVKASDLPTNLDDGEVFVASWGGGLSGGADPNGLKIGNQRTNAAFDVQKDVATRYPVCLTDNGNGTVTFDAGPASATVDGSFPDGPVRVVFYDHSYTPDKAPAEGHPFGGKYTFHWDNVSVT